MPNNGLLPAMDSAQSNVLLTGSFNSHKKGHESMSDLLMWTTLLVGLIVVHRLAKSVEKKFHSRISSAPAMMLKKMKFITLNRLFDGENAALIAVRKTPCIKNYIFSFDCLCKTNKEAWFIYTFEYNARTNKGFNEEVNAINEIGAKRFLATDIETYRAIFGEPVQA